MAHKPVTFLDADGNVISNDPVWRAQQLLGVESDEDMPEDQSTEDSSPYEGMSGKELKELAAERNIDITGLRKVSEVRAALEAADADESENDTEEE